MYFKYLVNDFKSVTFHAVKWLFRADEQKTPFFVVAVVYTTSNYSTYGSAAKPFAISTADHLRQIATISSNSGKDFNGKIIKLMNDIDMSGVTDFYGIGYAPLAYTGARDFMGTFDGNGKKITNLVINSDNRSTGFILSAGVGAVIKNLGIKLL